MHEDGAWLLRTRQMPRNSHEGGGEFASCRADFHRFSPGCGAVRNRGGAVGLAPAWRLKTWPTLPRTSHALAHALLGGNPCTAGSGFVTAMSEGAWFEGLLQRTFGNTPFLKGDAADYLLALIIAVVIPIFRYIADSTIHDVRGERGIRLTPGPCAPARFEPGHGVLPVR